MDARGAAPPAQIGRYVMYGEIGAGGMATVHLGRGPGGEIVAIKRLKPHLVAEAEVVASFLDEARLSARVRHANVVSTLDVVTHDGEAFLIMEYIEGVSLSSLARNAPPVAADLAVAVLVGVLRGLHAAHEAPSEAGEPLHIVHRDVSPHNVLVGVDGTVRVLDFGVAKALGRQQTTRDGTIKGKLGYMAPEQLSGRGVTRRTDIFAAAIVLWELLVGERLFHANDEAATVTRVLMERVRPPSAARAGVPATLDPIVLRALDRDPSKRFLTAEDMANALAEAVTPAAAAAVGWWVRSVAAEELARRAVLLRAQTAQRIDQAPGVETPFDATDTIANDVAPAAGSGRRRALGAASAIVAAALVAWMGVSMSRARDTQARSVATAAGPPDGVEATAAPPASAAPSASAPAPKPPPTAPPAAAADPTPGRGSSHRGAPKTAAPRATGSARERLYSRD